MRSPPKARRKARERRREAMRGIGRRLGAAGLLAVAAACTSGPPPPPDDRPYEARVLASRVEKDDAFRALDNKDSPIPIAERASFPGLAYYPIDPAYRAPAYLTEDRGGPPVYFEIQMSTGTREKMRRVGTLGFTLGEATYRLTAFAEADARTIDRLFVPYADLTSGSETYGGGRYLNLNRTPTGLYDLDFNTAYHPYCLYNPGYECPVPPRENRLPIAIRAGERLAAPH
jgi:uncharacterized protein